MNSKPVNPHVGHGLNSWLHCSDEFEKVSVVDPSQLPHHIFHIIRRNGDVLDDSVFLGGGVRSELHLGGSRVGIVPDGIVPSKEYVT